MVHYKYLILGAGPAGLTVANRLLQLGEKDFLVIEKEGEAGGLCRTSEAGGRPIDIGGGHFLDVKRPDVLRFLFQFLEKKEWSEYERDSRIDLGETVISSPIEANIWQLPFASQVEYLKSIACAGCNVGTQMPEKFVDWIYWKLGDKIAESYMIPYNQKMFGDNLDLLGTYWLNKLPNVSFEDTLMSCLQRKAYGEQPGHARFYYPRKYGYGEIWLRMADAIRERIIYNEAVSKIDYDQRIVNGCYQADVIVNTIPWTSIKTHIALPSQIKKCIDNLKYSSVVVEYHEETLETGAQWIYCPNSNYSYHRILVRSNFCPHSVGYWTETNLTRFSLEQHGSEQYYVNEYAYPLNTIGKNESMNELLSWMQTKNVYGLGRWGEWQHYNSDVVVDLGLQLVKKLLK